MKMDIVFTLTIYALGMVLAAVGSRLSARCTVWCCALCGLPMWVVGGMVAPVCLALPQLVFAFLAAGSGLTALAVGVALAGMLAEETLVTAAGAAALSLGIAIQNIPEGAIISAPLAAGGLSRGRAFGRGVLSGAVEPLGAVVTLALTRQITLLLPYVLAFAAGCMLYVVVVELIPETQCGQRSAAGAVGAAIGFVVMMVLDVALG